MDKWIKPDLRHPWRPMGRNISQQSRFSTAWANFAPRRFVHISSRAGNLFGAFLQIVVSISQAPAPANFWDDLIGLDFYGQCHLFSNVYNSNFICVSKYVSFRPWKCSCFVSRLVIVPRRRLPSTAGRAFVFAFGFFRLPSNSFGGEQFFSTFARKLHHVFYKWYCCCRAELLVIYGDKMYHIYSYST